MNPPITPLYPKDKIVDRMDFQFSLLKTQAEEKNNELFQNCFLKNNNISTRCRDNTKKNFLLPNYVSDKMYNINVEGYNPNDNDMKLDKFSNVELDKFYSASKISKKDNRNEHYERDWTRGGIDTSNIHNMNIKNVNKFHLEQKQ